MSDSKPSCAHSRVKRNPEANDDGSLVDRWRCDDCQRVFIPEPVRDMSFMTLGELEETAERMGKAVATIKEAQSLLGGRVSGTMVHPKGHTVQVIGDDDGEQPPPRPEAPADAVAAHRARQFQPVDADIPRELVMPKRPRMSAAEQSQRAALLGQFQKAPVDPNLPEDMQALEQGEPPR